MSSSSYNRNPAGHNQYSHLKPAEEDEPRIDQALEKYHRQRLFSNEKISALLLKEHGLTIASSAVKRCRKALGFHSPRVTMRTMPYQEMVQHVIEELNRDHAGYRGVQNIQAKITFNCGVTLSRDFVTDVMHTHAPEGFAMRDPTSKRVLRVVKANFGIHERWSGDGHDKLYSIGFPIWAVVDDATSKWLGAWVVPSNRLGAIVGYLCLLLIEKFQGMPLQFSTDCGSETTQLYGLVNALRATLFPEYDGETLPAHSYVRSVHNIAIERSWLRLRLDWGNNAVLVFNAGITDGKYNPDNCQQYELCQYLWPKLLRQELDKFVEFRNGVRMRRDNKKAGPSGCSRNMAFSLHENYGLVNCLLRISDMSIIHKLKEEMGGDALLDFVSPEFSERAESAYESLSISELTFENVWEIFQALLPLVFPPDIELE